MKRDKRVPDSDEGESKEKTEGSSKFSQKGLPEVDQLFSLHLDYSYFHSILLLLDFKQTSVSLAIG